MTKARHSWKLLALAASLGLAFAMPAGAQTSDSSKGAGSSSSQSSAAKQGSSSDQSASSGASGQSAAGGQSSSLDQGSRRESDGTDWGWLGLLGLLGLGGLMRRRGEHHDVRYDGTRRPT